MTGTRLGDQKGWWDFRAEQSAGNYGASLVLDSGEVDFQRRHLKPHGDTLVLGATRSLCALALEKHASVTAADFSETAIQVGRLDGVRYVCADWNDYLERDDTGGFDNIVTDGGMLCLNFPDSWEEIARNIHGHLRPGGIFAAKFYISKQEPLKEYKNPNLGRFIALPSHAEKNWAVTPDGSDYKKFDVSYTLPPRQEVLRVFEDIGRLTLLEEFTPDYEAGDRFPSFAWQRF